MSLARCDTTWHHTGSIYVVTSDWNRALAFPRLRQAAARSVTLNGAAVPNWGRMRSALVPSISIYPDVTHMKLTDPFTPTRWR